VLAGDTEAALAARVLAAEHRLYPVALAAALGRDGAGAGEIVMSVGGTDQRTSPDGKNPPLRTSKRAT
jgi:hypothetical protein